MHRNSEPLAKQPSPQIHFALKIGFLLLAITFPSWVAFSSAQTNDSITVSWDEFKILFRDNIVRELQVSEAQPTVEDRAVLDTSHYEVSLTPEYATLEASLSGRVLSGAPIIPLFDKSLLLTEVLSLDGGTLIAHRETLALLPAEKEFQLTLKMLLPVTTENQSYQAGFTGPHCLKSSLKLSLPKGYSLEKMPGILTPDGLVHFDSSSPVNLSYTAAATQNKAPKPTISFATMETPVTVLDRVYYYCTFEETGGALSTLKTTVPPTTGFLNITRIPGARVWSVTVNGTAQKLYAQTPETWSIPLNEKKASHIELTYLNKAQKLGLKGRIETQIPTLNFPTRELCIGLDLPQRVALISLEGDCTATTPQSWELPDKTMQKPHFFTRAFYEGQGMPLAIYYKEPIAPKRNLQNNI